MTLQDDIRAVADAEGMDFFGVADITPAHEAISAQGGERIGAFPRAVSIGKTLVHAIVDMLGEPLAPEAAELYRYFCYDLVNDRLDTSGLRIASVLQEAGHAALPVPAAYRGVDLDRLCGIFSNKLAAHLAGLGWIGRSCLLVTPEVGPRVRWASVLTDAPLAPTGGAMSQRCGSCRACVAACPSQAFTGHPFHDTEGREARFDAFACDRHLRETEERTGHNVCGMCLKVCPHGARKSRRRARRGDS